MTPSRKPRTCGEKFNPFSPPLSEWGSPPHVRGKAKERECPPGTPWITPACAGKSRCACTRARSVRDHPRMCGEKGAFRHRSRPFLWITPACAGKRKRDGHYGAAIRDHPRMCGEKLESTGSLIAQWGSPPHVRGKVSKQEIISVVMGITPACAGKSTSPT